MPGRNERSAMKFQASLDRSFTLLPEQVEAFKVKVCFQILRGVVLKTPVDTGRARGGWQVELNARGTSTGVSDKSGQAAINAGSATILSSQLSDAIYISNTIEYIVYLEEGRPGPGSNQAPQGMVAITLQEVSRQFGAAA